MLDLLIRKVGGAGLNLIKNAIFKKGKSLVEKIVKDTGIDLFSTNPLTAEQKIQLKEYELTHEESLLNICLEDKKVDFEWDKVAQINLTQRHEQDMKSDSWLSKNVRPLTLVALVLSTIVAVFAQLPKESVAELASLLKYVFGFYFIGRSTEKVTGGAISKSAKALLGKVRGGI